MTKDKKIEWKYQSGDATRRLLWGKLLFDVVKRPEKYLVSLEDYKLAHLNQEEK